MSSVLVPNARSVCVCTVATTADVACPQLEQDRRAAVRNTHVFAKILMNNQVCVRVLLNA